MKKTLPELSKSEWTIMKVCWQKGSCAARDVHESTYEEKQWEYPTVKTMMDRIVKKGYLERKKFGAVYVYTPTISQTNVLSKAIKGFMETVLDNTFAPIFSHFVSEKDLSEKDVKALQKLIDKYEDKDGAT